MKIQTNLLPTQPPETGGISDRLSIDIDVAADLVGRAKLANARAQDWIAKGNHQAAASAAGQAMMLARQAEIVSHPAKLRELCGTTAKCC